MGITVYNPQKGRLETMDIVFTKDNTTWFDECEERHDIYTITDWQGNLLIKEFDYTYPLYVYDISRADICYDQNRAKAIRDEYIQMPD